MGVMHEEVTMKGEYEGIIKWVMHVEGIMELRTDARRHYRMEEVKMRKDYGREDMNKGIIEGSRLFMGCILRGRPTHNCINENVMHKDGRED